ncbi:MAG: hypothetical protein H8E38_02135 [SAR324 cluster bacterium]|nr:hypothetical protein [SAR324 cluster bacterium]MBL7034907.1 hypothetical protein [SAR324 cluster bacterium]
MQKWLLIPLIVFLLTPELSADYFKWEILIFDKGYGTESLIIPVNSEGLIKSMENLAECRMESFWTSITADLLLEGKTIVCVSKKNNFRVNVVCSDNHRNRKYNKVKELYPTTKEGILLKPELGSNSPYLELRCYF